MKWNIEDPICTFLFKADTVPGGPRISSSATIIPTNIWEKRLYRCTVQKNSNLRIHWKASDDGNLLENVNEKVFNTKQCVDRPVNFVPVYSKIVSCFWIARQQSNFKCVAKAFSTTSGCHATKSWQLMKHWSGIQSKGKWIRIVH